MDSLFIINRVVDAFFSIDMVLNFHIAYQESASLGGGWVINQRFIVRTYVRGWFAIDLGSILPFWVVPFVTDSNEAAAAAPLSSGVLNASAATAAAEVDDSSALVLA